MPILNSICRKRFQLASEGGRETFRVEMNFEHFRLGMSADVALGTLARRKLRRLPRAKYNFSGGKRASCRHCLDNSARSIRNIPVLVNILFYFSREYSQHTERLATVLERPVVV